MRGVVFQTVKESRYKYVLGVFVDFKSAFDNLEWKYVLNRLRKVGCDEIGLWERYFDERYVCMTVANETVRKRVERGCPQGFMVCDPFIWKLMMDELQWRLYESGCKVVAYADDLLMVEGRSRVELKRKRTE